MKHFKRWLKSHIAKPRLPQSEPSQTEHPRSLPSAPPTLRAQGTPLKVILFIGHHKVGSTSLQDYLSRNAPALARAGILYPYVDFEGMAYMAAAAAGHPIPDGPLPFNIRAPHNALAFRMMSEDSKRNIPPWHKMLPALGQMEHAIRQQVRFFNPHTVILAAEVFANFNAKTPQSIQRLADLFPEADFTIIATLRRIDEYLVSWQGQQLKFGRKPQPLRDDGLNAYLKGIHFNYQLMIEGWIERFPEARIILRNYADVRANGGSVADFLAQTGLAIPDGLIPEQLQNMSFHRGVYEIIRRGNAELPPKKAAMLRRMMAELPSQFDLPQSSKIELFGSKNRKELVQKFRPINSYLGHLTGQAGFFSDLDCALETLETPEIEAQRAALEGIRKNPKIRNDSEFQNFFKTLHSAFE